MRQRQARARPKLASKSARSGRCSNKSSSPNSTSAYRTAYVCLAFELRHFLGFLTTPASWNALLSRPVPVRIVQLIFLAFNLSHFLWVCLFIPVCMKGTFMWCPLPCHSVMFGWRYFHARGVSSQRLPASWNALLSRPVQCVSYTSNASPLNCSTLWARILRGNFRCSVISVVLSCPDGAMLERWSWTTLALWNVFVSRARIFCLLVFSFAYLSLQLLKNPRDFRLPPSCSASAYTLTCGTSFENPTIFSFPWHRQASASGKGHRRSYST